MLDIPHNGSNVSFELGYFLTPKVRLLALGAGQLMHGGIDLNLAVPLSPEYLRQHDRISRDEFINVGGGAAYSLNEKVDIFGSVIHTVTARNIHAIDRGVSVGLSCASP